MLNQVKRDVATVTDIPVFRQSWTGTGTLTIVNVNSKRAFCLGWPENTNDELSLIQIGLENDSTLRVNLVRRHDRQEPQVGPRTYFLNFDDTRILNNNALQ